MTPFTDEIPKDPLPPGAVPIEAGTRVFASIKNWVYVARNEAEALNICLKLQAAWNDEALQIYEATERFGSVKDAPPEILKAAAETEMTEICQTIITSGILASDQVPELLNHITGAYSKAVGGFLSEEERASARASLGFNPPELRDDWDEDEDDEEGEEK